MIAQLSILLIILLVSIVVLYFTTCYKKDTYDISAVRLGRYDPEIVEKSGGMAGFSTFPAEVHPVWYEYDYLPDSLYSRTYYDRPYIRPFEYYINPWYVPDEWMELNDRIYEAENLVGYENMGCRHCY